jgi:glucosylceramidase
MRATGGRGSTGGCGVRLVAAALGALMLAACGTPGASLPPPGADEIAAWVTTADRQQLLQRQRVGPRFGRTAAGAQVIEVDDTRRYQVMAGFGASMTDASAWLIQQRMSAAQRQALMQELFGRGEQGLGMDLVRLTLGASDFSFTHYSYADRPPGETDLPLAHFSIEPARRDVLPVVRQALELNPSLQVMASPWSAPGWMKTSDSLIKGSLRPDMYDAFARYLVAAVEAFAAEGVPLFALTVQNEPHFEPDDYPGMRVTPQARAEFVAHHLGPLLGRKGLPTRVIEWDHNWDDPDAALAVLGDPAARRWISGVGWHCYVSDQLLPNQTRVREAYPELDVWLTECSGGEWKPHWPETLPWLARTLVIGATRHWARGVLMWNLALDEQHGPHRGGCKDCRGVVTIDSRSGEVTRNMEYYAFAHASRFVRRGAQRIESSPGVDGVDSVAFRNADDGSLVLVLANSASSQRDIVVQHRGRAARHILPRESVTTLQWAP